MCLGKETKNPRGAFGVSIFGHQTRKTSRLTSILIKCSVQFTILQSPLNTIYPSNEMNYVLHCAHFWNAYMPSFGLFSQEYMFLFYFKYKCKNSIMFIPFIGAISSYVMIIAKNLFIVLCIIYPITSSQTTYLCHY